MTALMPTVSCGCADPLSNNLIQCCFIAFDLIHGFECGNSAVIFFPGQYSGRVFDESVFGLLLNLRSTVKDQLDLFGWLDPHRNTILLTDTIVRSVPFYVFGEAGMSL